MTGLITLISERFARLPDVTAIALGGSQAFGTGGIGSDYDLYLYTTQAIPAAVRLAISREFSPNAQLVDFWGPGVEWDDPRVGTHIDMIYFDADWIADQVERCLTRHEAWMGYTTAFWHTVRVSRILFDRTGWYTGLHERAQAPYPPELARAIVALNLPVLRNTFSSYRSQLDKAANRGDLVSLNHRTTALLASVFDILFAVNHVTHPGEKRLLELVERLCPQRPPTFSEDVKALLRSAAAASPSTAAAVDRLVDGIETVVRAAGLD